MSSLIVEISKIAVVQPHPNADRLELAQIKGWQCVVPKGKYTAGDIVTYVPVDAVLPVELADRLGVTNHLGVNGRVRCAKLRGEPSFGLVFDRENAEWSEGTDVAAHYGITKYIPPVKITAGDAETDAALFVSYTSIENMRNFNRVFEPGEQVVVTEKIHGTNCRVGVCEENGVMTEMAGSKEIRRRRPLEANIASDLYWHPWSLPSVRALMGDVVSLGAKQVILFGEVYGKVQSLRYGLGNSIGFRAFDMIVDGKYVDYERFTALCNLFGVPHVPLVYFGPFDLAKIKELSDGKTLMPDADHIREGVIVRPVVERTDPKIGRVILKYVGDSYLFGDVSDTNDV